MTRRRRSFALCRVFSAPLRLCGRWPSLLRRRVPVSPRRGGPRSEKEDRGEVSRRDAETRRGLLFGHFSASLRLCGRSRSLLRYGVSVSLRRGGPRSEEDDRVEVSPQRRRDAESLYGSTKNHVRSCRLQFDGVGEKRTRNCFRARKITTEIGRAHV